jgi:hypothetical protein
LKLGVLLEVKPQCSKGKRAMALSLSPRKTVPLSKRLVEIPQENSWYYYSGLPLLIFCSKKMLLELRFKQPTPEYI